MKAFFPESFFNMTRDNVLFELGTPSKSGEAFTDPFLGKYGAWDRFKKNRLLSAF